MVKLVPNGGMLVWPQKIGDGFSRPVQEAIQAIEGVVTRVDHLIHRNFPLTLLGWVFRIQATRLDTVYLYSIKLLSIDGGTYRSGSIF